MKQIKTFSAFLVLLLGLSAAGTAVLFLSTAPWGMGARTDAIAYIGGAREILNGHGFRMPGTLKPITHWPPFYSVSLAMLGLLGIDPLEGARVLNHLLFGMNIFLTGMILKRFTGSGKAALAGAWLMMTYPAMLSAHTGVWCEPLYIFLTLMSFFFLMRYLGQEGRWSLFYAAFCVALAALTRYTGFALIGAGILTVFFLHQKGFFARTRDCILFALCCSLPLGLWLLRNRLVANNLFRTTVQFRVPSSEYFKNAAEAISTWVLPIEFPLPLRYLAFLLIALIFLIATIIVIQREVKAKSIAVLASDDSLRFFISMLIFVGCNAALILLYLILMHVHMSTRERHYLLMYLASLMALVVISNKFLKHLAYNSILKSIFLVLFLSIGSTHLYGAALRLWDMYQNGEGDTSRIWRTSETLARVKTLPAGSLIYANDVASIYFLANRTASRLPYKYSRRRWQKNKKAAVPEPSYLPDLMKIKKKLQSKNGYVVFLDQQHRWYRASEKELQTQLSLVLMERLSDGGIYQMKKD
jgi:4-amino-4-deoxy-L-arabinose transferase-like glycosyltransferase